MDNALRGIVVLVQRHRAPSAGANFYGTNSLYSKIAGNTYRYTFNPAQSGTTEVHLWWTAYSSRATNVPIVVTHAGGTNAVYVNQQLNGGQWNLLGTWNFGSSATVTVRAVGDPKSTSADAVMLVPVAPPAPPPGSCYTVSRPNVLASTLSLPSGTTGPYIFSIPPDQDGTKGTASIANASTGQFQYVPNGNDWGIDSFVYNVDASDGPRALSATVVIAPRIMPLGDSITSGIVDGNSVTPLNPIG